MWRWKLVKKELYQWKGVKCTGMPAGSDDVRTESGQRFWPDPVTTRPEFLNDEDDKGDDDPYAAVYHPSDPAWSWIFLNRGLQKHAKQFSSKSQTGIGRVILDISTSQSSHIHNIQSGQPRLKPQSAWIGVEHWRGSCGRPEPPLCKMNPYLCHYVHYIYAYNVIWINIAY